MQHAVLATSEDLYTKVAAALGCDGGELIQVSSWTDLRLRQAEVQSVVASAHGGTTQAWIDEAVAFSVIAPRVPMVLWPCGGADPLPCHVLQGPWDALMPPDPSLADARADLFHAHLRRELSCLADRTRSARACGPLIRRAVEVALRVPWPVRTVSRLARLLGVNEAALQRGWRCLVPLDPPLGDRGPLRAMIGGLVVVHAVARKTRMHSWSEVASQLGVHRDTLARNAQSVYGQSLRELSVLGWRVPLMAFKGTFLDRLACATHATET